MIRVEDLGDQALDLVVARFVKGRAKTLSQLMELLKMPPEGEERVLASLDRLRRGIPVVIKIRSKYRIFTAWHHPEAGAYMRERFKPK